MEMTRLAHEADFIFEVEGYTGDLRVLSFSGSEGMSELYGFGIRLASDDSAIDIDAIVGQPGILTIFHEGGERKVYGIVSRFEQGSLGGEYTPYFAQLVPDVWLLTQRYSCRIFQDKTVQDIVTKVLTDAQIPEDRFRFSLNQTHAAREYCVQYRESDWNFISRLLEEEGIFYFFEHGEDGCVLVMADDSSIYTPIESPDSIPFREASGTVAEEEAVYEYRFSQEIRPGKITYRSFSFEKPDIDLQKDATGERDDALEVYDYHGGYIDPGAGQQAATLAMESVQACRVIGIGQSVCRRFLPGYTFTLEDHPRLDFNRDLLLIRVSHTGVQPHGETGVGGHFEYNNEFRCIPVEITFRPVRRAAKPVVHGTQTAIVTGPKGEEIWPDKHGRVKVQFHWDREGNKDENSSCWIRVSQLWAGKGWGAMWIPRINQEVIVDFLEGDPDRPIIVGRVYHGTNMPPYELPKDKTKSTVKSESSLKGGGFNEIRFEDNKGSEEVFVHAQKDMNEKIENCMTTTVGANQTISVGGNRTKTVKKKEENTIESDRYMRVNGDQLVEVKGTAGFYVLEGEYQHHIMAGGAAYSVAQDVCEDIHGSQFTTVGKDILIRSDLTKITITAATEIKLEVGASKLLLKADGSIELKGVNLAIDGALSVNIHGLSVTSQADADHNTKGAIVVSEGMATNSVKGGMVMLNP